MQKVLTSSLEIFDQLHQFIDSVDEQHYKQYSKPLFESTIGQHLRHILDIYQALRRFQPGHVVDYDIRFRGAALEEDKAAALQCLQEIAQWLQSLKVEQLSQPLVINTEVAISEQYSAEFNSSFGRELFFASNHAIHHLALMVILAKVQGCKVDERFGVAPATASYLREQELIQCAH